MGVFLYEMVYGNPFFEADGFYEMKKMLNEEEIFFWEGKNEEINKIFKKEYFNGEFVNFENKEKHEFVNHFQNEKTVNKFKKKNINNFLKFILVKDFNKRPSLDQILDHDIWKGFDLDRDLNLEEKMEMRKNYFINTQFMKNRVIPDFIKKLDFHHFNNFSKNPKINNFLTNNNTLQKNQKIYNFKQNKINLKNYENNNIIEKNYQKINKIENLVKKDFYLKNDIGKVKNKNSDIFFKNEKILKNNSKRIIYNKNMNFDNKEKIRAFSNFVNKNKINENIINKKFDKADNKKKFYFGNLQKKNIIINEEISKKLINNKYQKNQNFIKLDKNINLYKKGNYFNLLKNTKNSENKSLKKLSKKGNLNNNKIYLKNNENLQRVIYQKNINFIKNDKIAKSQNHSINKIPYDFTNYKKKRKNFNNLIEKTIFEVKKKIEKKNLLKKKSLQNFSQNKIYKNFSVHKINYQKPENSIFKNLSKKNLMEKKIPKDQIIVNPKFKYLILKRSESNPTSKKKIIYLSPKNSDFGNRRNFSLSKFSPKNNSFYNFDINSNISRKKSRFRI